MFNIEASMNSTNIANNFDGANTLTTASVWYRPRKDRRLPEFLYFSNGPSHLPQNVPPRVPGSILVVFGGSYSVAQQAGA